jgi:hypothetical protein
MLTARDFKKGARDMFFVLCAATPALVEAQATDCNDAHASPEANSIAQQQWENQSSPAYEDATELARSQ